MSTVVRAPDGVTSIGYQGEEYKPDASGMFTVPDLVAVDLIGGHGFVAYSDGSADYSLHPIVAPMLVESNDEIVADDEGDAPPPAPTPEEVVVRMTQFELKTFMRQYNLPIPRGITIGELRALVAAQMHKMIDEQAAHTETQT
jgi:hypothetical protein